MPSPLPDEELLSALRSAAPAPPQNLLDRWQPPVSSRPLRSRRPWMAALGAAAGCGITLAFLPGSLLHPTPTFAEMEEAILQAKTVSWTERFSDAYVLYPDGTAKKTGAGSLKRSWADLRIPAIARIGKHFREVSRDGRTFQIGNEPGGLRTYHAFRWSLLMELNPALGKPDENQLRAEIVRSVVLPKIKTQSGEWRSSRETIHGHEYLKLSRTLPGPKSTGKWKIESTEYSFWIDPQTRRVFKRETKERNQSPQQTIEAVSVCEDFRYDEIPPAGLFDIQPPVGSRYLYTPQPDRKIKPEDDKAIRAIVAKAEQAWKEGDASTYLSLWRFDYPTTGSSRAVQLAAIRNPNRYRWSYKYGPQAIGARISGIYTHRAGDAFPPKAPVEFGCGFWGLLKESGSFKIVRLSVPAR